MTTPEIAITNLVPKLFSDADCKTLAAVAAAALPAFCEEWGKTVPVVTIYPNRSDVPNTSWEIALLDTDTKDEAFHEDPNGFPDGKVFAGYMLSQGGDKWVGELAVSVAFMHELFEMLGNPRTNLIIQESVKAPNGKIYAGIWHEVCDPAQGEHFEFNIDGTIVWTAGYVTQSWTDPMGRAPFSKPLGIVPLPLSIGASGYGGYVDLNGNVTEVFGEKCHPAIVALKTRCSRLVKPKPKTGGPSWLQSFLRSLFL